MINLFLTPTAFHDFRHEVLYRRRFMRSGNGEAFLLAVKKTMASRIRNISAGDKFWRAQIGHDWIRDAERGTREKSPHQTARMKPLVDRAFEGRVNPKGIPCLYLATTKYVAMSEVRPWIGSAVSLARFQTTRDLTVIDCSVFHSREPSPQDEPSDDEIERIVWTDIDHAFSRPIMRSDNTADYAATQVIAEFFRAEGYDGVIYGSAFSEEGCNIALFDLDAADQMDAQLYEVKNATFDFQRLKRSQAA